eukprot:6202757-Pleurochrysis_carterae.AAC.1
MVVIQVSQDTYATGTGNASHAAVEKRYRTSRHQNACRLETRPLAVVTYFTASVTAEDRPHLHRAPRH